MDVKKADLIIFKRALAKAASLTAQQVFDDTLCTNPFQNIFVVATPFEVNARAYARVQQISMGKIVIWSGGFTQVDVCCACGDLGHRADVCPKGEGQKKCRGCGMQTPSQDHQCDPQCAICGGAHQTADRKCSKRFQVPCVVRRTSCTSWHLDQAAPLQLGAKRHMRENNNSPPLAATDRHREDTPAPVPEDAAAADRALAQEGATVAADALVLQDDRVPRFESRNQCPGRTRPG
ncbi:hypothetical protein MTO96_013702 [Rhipicephalus appendiculatus]